MSKREQILAAALNLFIENGFEKTPTSAISKAAGVATGTLFHHFKTKEELINALYLEVKLALLENLATKTAPSLDLKGGTEANLKIQIQALWFNMIDWVLQNPQEFRFLAQFGESAYIANSTREKIEEAFAGSKALFCQGVEEGLFYDLPLDLLLNLTTSHIFASCNYFLLQTEQWQDRDIQRKVFASFWSLLAKVK
ncbi:MAG: TetR/AcrR family transcriptional regulator [Oleispira sp.]